MYRYKNKTDQELTVIGLGIIKPGEEFKVGRLIESANLEILERPKEGEQSPANSVVGKEAAQPGAVTEANRVGDVPTDTQNQEELN